MLTVQKRRGRQAVAEDPGTALRALHRPGDPFVLMNAWDVGSARLMAALGAQAIGTTSAGFAFTLGLPDGARISCDQALEHAASLVAATPLPVSADLENGYGETPEEVAETIRLAAQAGVAGASIEDTDLPGEGAYWFDLAIDRVRAAVEAARALPRDFVLVARADGLLTGAYDVKEAERRLEAYAEAGADCVYAPLLPDLTAVRRVCAAIPVPVNVLAAGPMLAHSRAELAGAGVARISLGSGLARVGQAAVLAAVGTVLDAGDFHPLAAGVSGAEVDAMLAKGGASRSAKR
jgi:2-methylisocitrate lyase-like PEP mutase family enzyme